LVPARFHIIQPSEKVRKLGRMAAANTPEAMHLDLATAWRPEEGVMRRGKAVRTRAELGAEVLSDLSPLERALWFDSVQGLPGDMLVKVDRATMNVGLEARQPLLDHRLFEASWRLPPSMKLRGGVGKWPLREILAKYVPRALWERPKSGFSVPIDAWLRGPLRGWAEDLLSPGALRDHGIFDEAPITRAWQRHLSGTENHGTRLWTVLSAQAWLKGAGG
jgi:asparagine synthase (glutamine-hydrolysing)